MLQKKSDLERSNQSCIRPYWQRIGGPVAAEQASNVDEGLAGLRTLCQLHHALLEGELGVQEASCCTCT